MRSCDPKNWSYLPFYIFLTHTVLFTRYRASWGEASILLDFYFEILLDGT